MADNKYRVMSTGELIEEKGRLFNQIVVIKKEQRVIVDELNIRHAQRKLDTFTDAEKNSMRQILGKS